MFIPTFNNIHFCTSTAFLMQTDFILCEVRTKCLHIIQMRVKISKN